MMSANWSDFLQKLLAILFAGTGTWLAVRNYYEKRHSDVLERQVISQTKAYAAERDFEHLRRNQEQMQIALAALDDELSDVRENTREVKGMLVAVFGRSGESGFFGRQEKH